MKRRMICFALIGAALLSLMTGCGTESKPAVTLNIKTPLFSIDPPAGLEDYQDIYSFLSAAAEDFAAQYTEADVTVHVTQYSGDRQTAELDGCFDTEDAVDVLFSNLSSYLFTGRVVPLDDIISDEIYSDIDESVWETCRFDGKTYLMPFFGSQMVLCYNRELFRQAGLDAYLTEEDTIQSWTLEEWDEILRALRAELPNSVYPMMMYAANSSGDMHIMTLLRSRGSTFFDDDNLFDLETPEGTAALQWLRDCNENGYFPPNAENLEMLDCYDLFMNGQLAIYCANTSHQIMYDEAGLDYGLVNFPSEDGAGFNTTTYLTFQVFDNGDDAKVDVAKAFVKYIYESDWLDYSAAAIPVSSKVSEKYKSELNNVWKYIENLGRNNNYTGNNPGWNEVRKEFYLHIRDLLYGEKDVSEIASELDSTCNTILKSARSNSSFHP